jgi:hypothetical protein
MHRWSVRLFPVLLIAVLCNAPAAHAARVLDSYCSPSGDYCTSVTVNGGRVKLNIATFSFTGRYRICVRGPRNKRCHRFHLRRNGELYVDRVDWANNFPSAALGTYHVSWHKFGARLGRVLSWREV